MVFTAAQSSSQHTPTPLPPDFVSLCQTASLSNVAFSSQKSLPRQLWTSEKKDFYSVLRLCFTTLSPATTAKCETLADTLKSVLFNLAIFHAATVATSSQNVVRTLHHPHVSHFTGCVEELLALTRHGGGGGAGTKMDTSAVVKALTAHVREVYSRTLTQDKLDYLVEACLSEEVTRPSARVKLNGLQLLPDVEVTVPSQATSVKMFGDYVKGLMEASGPQQQTLLRYTCIRVFFPV